MKKYLHQALCVACFACMGLAYTACEKIEEVPPINQAGVSPNNYKLPDPTVLSPEERAVVEAIKAEYQAGIRR